MNCLYGHDCCAVDCCCDHEPTGKSSYVTALNSDANVGNIYPFQLTLYRQDTAFNLFVVPIEIQDNIVSYYQTPQNDVWTAQINFRVLRNPSVPNPSRYVFAIPNPAVFNGTTQVNVGDVILTQGPVNDRVIVNPTLTAVSFADPARAPRVPAYMIVPGPYINGVPFYGERDPVAETLVPGNIVRMKLTYTVRPYGRVQGRPLPSRLSFATDDEWLSGLEIDKILAAINGSSL